MLAFFLLLGTPATPADIPLALERAVNESRRAAGASAVERVAELDAVALSRAREAARLPESGRFGPRPTAEESLRDAKIAGVLGAWLYLAWQGGYADEAGAAVANWRDYAPGWERALDPTWKRAGFATARAQDGSLVVVALFVEPSPELPASAAIEEAVVTAINREREAHGLGRLVADPALSAVARAHSRDMLERDYFAHRSPEGLGASGRVAAAGIPFRLVAENLAQNVRVVDPAAEAVKQWMTSPGHRDNVLDPRFTRTAVGVAVDAQERRLIFTQLFLRPAGSEGDE